MIRKLMIMPLFFVMACNGISQQNKADMAQKSEQETFEVVKTDDEWKKELTDIEYYVLRKAATENPFTSDLLDNKEKGTYICAGCSTPLFKSETKFKSGTGWPSFYQEIEGNVAYEIDRGYGMVRTEEHCATCGGHLGHVFEDGPEPTGKRHCINGAALDFIPDPQ